MKIWTRLLARGGELGDPLRERGVARFQRLDHEEGEAGGQADQGERQQPDGAEALAQLHEALLHWRAPFHAAETAKATGPCGSLEVASWRRSCTRLSDSWRLRLST